MKVWTFHSLANKKLSRHVVRNTAAMRLLPAGFGAVLACAALSSPGSNLGPQCALQLHLLAQGLGTEKQATVVRRSFLTGIGVASSR